MRVTKRRTNEERSETTRAALIQAARTLFIERTYAGTGTPELVAAAGVTRGALYHHFEDKQALFRAVIVAESAEVAREIHRGAAGQQEPLDALLHGGDSYLAAMAVRGRTRLLLIEAPAVLGPEEADAIDSSTIRPSLRDGLESAMRAGVLRALPLDAITSLMSSAYDRASLAIEAGANPDDWRLVLRSVLEGLRPTHQP